jgi:peptide/nickel transport system substrate-binding protein
VTARPAACALSLLLLAACRGQAPAATSAATEIRIHLPAEPPHLNPLLSSDFLVTQVALGDVYEPLFTLDAHGAIVPVLAERVEVAPDGSSFTFTLRANVRWHDGQPVTSADVVYTLRLLAPGGAPAVLSADFDDVKSVTAVDERTVRLDLGGFRLGRRESLALVPVLPAHIFAATPAADLLAHPASRAPIGTGPYAFAVWLPGREIQLRRAATWRGPPPAAERIVYRVVADRAQALAQLDSGDLHLVLSVANAQLGDAARDTKIRLEPYAFPYYIGARWSCRPGRALADARVRRALTMLLDRDTIVRTIQNGRGRVASAPWEPDDDAYDASVAPWPFDPEAARALLAAANATSLHVSLLVPAGSATLGRVATIWQADAKRAGVSLDVVEDAAVIDRARAGDFEGFAFGWTTGPEQDLFHHFHSPPAGTDNYGGCADAEVDRLLEAVRAQPDHTARVALEHALHRRLHELEWLTVISVDVRTAAAAKALGGVHPGAHGTPARELTLTPP